MAECQFETISNYLDLFDIPSIHTSRYMISGPMIFQLDASTDITFSEVTVEIPNIGLRELEVKNSDETTYYDSFVYGDYKEQNSLKMNVMTSRISYPEENIIRVSYSASKAGKISFYGYVGEQSPIYVDLINPQLTWLGEYAYEPKRGGRLKL